MKWIGQHIWDLVSRFRDDVYLEGVETGTIASGGSLGLDSNNKIVKASASSGGISFDGSTANGVLTYKDSDEATVESNLTFDGSTLTLAGDISATGDTFTFQSSNADDPVVIIKNTTADAQGARLAMRKDRGAAMVDGDRIGEIDFFGEDASQNQQQYAKIIVQALESDHGSETGRMKFQVAEYDGAVTDGLSISGGTSDGVIDVSVGAGTGSTTTIAGTLTMGSTAFVNNSGVVQVATQGTIDHDSLANFVANEHIDWTTDQGSTNIHSGNYTNTTYSEATSSDAGLMSTTHHDKLDGIETSADVTDATNVTAAGALMDSECSSLASVKALDQGVATGDSPQFAGINLGHANDTTFARSASGTATIEGKEIVTRDKVIYIETSNFSDDINTDAHYIPFVTTSEHTSFANVAVPFIAPAPGKLLGVHYKANNHTNTSSNTVTFRLDRLDDGLLWASSNEATIGTKVVDGVDRVNTCSADFTDLTTAGASGTNAFDANEMIGVSLQNSVNFTSTKYSVTLVFEFDFSSYYS